MLVMGLSEDILHALSVWCAGRIPEDERGHRQIGYTVHGTQVTILDRRAPAVPELGAEWPSTSLARLEVDGAGRWTLYRPADSGWTRTSEGADPIALLDAQAPA